MTDILVIGAGVVGGLVARELSLYDLSVTLVDRASDVAMGATKANSAIVHAGFDALPGTLKAKLNVRGSEMMPAITKDLGVKYRQNGSIVVGFCDEDLKTIEELKERGDRNGVPGVRVIGREELVKLEPNIGDEVTCALYAPTGAIVCPYELCMASIGNAMDNGAKLLLDFEVTGLEKTANGWKVSSADGRCEEAKYVINCAGVFSDVIAKLAGDDSFTITPRIGEYMLLDKECGDLVSHTIFHCPTKMGKGILVTPTVDNNLLLGPTAVDIIDSRLNTATTAAGLAKIRAQAGEQVKGLNFGKVITSFAGIRSVGSTGDFIINIPVPGFVNVAGIESPGLSASPAIAEYVRDMLAADGLELKEKAGRITTREPMHAFRDMSIEEKNEVIKKDPTYAHIICRCETVSEGEILAAIRTNPKPRDIDGVKRRTRATMGRCQGGFCTPYIVELLAKELGIKYEEVTKFGNGSYLNVGKTKETKK